MKGFFTKYRVTGLNFSRLLDDAVDHGIEIFDLKQKSAKIHEFKVKNEQKGEFLSLFELKNFSLEVLKSFGLRELCTKIVACLGGVIGASFGFLSFFLISLKVLDVEIIVPKNHHCTNGEYCIFEKNNLIEAKRYLESLGLFVGAKKSGVDAREIERLMLAKFEGLSGCVIETLGTKAKVSFVESTLDLSFHKHNFDIVAPENGIVTKLELSQGKARVREGETVTKGQILVAGSDGKRAIASVNMTCFQKKSAVHSEISFVFERTGKVCEFVSFEVFGAKLPFLEGKAQDHGFAFFEKEESNQIINPNLFVPVKKNVVKYYEITKCEKKTPIGEVRDEIRERLMVELQKLSGVSSSEEVKYHTVVSEIADAVFEIDCYIEYYRILN